MEARAAIESADKVFYLVADLITAAWIAELNPSAESLHDTYHLGRNRLASYEEMVLRILTPLREGHSVCVVFYGHPGVFVYPAHEAIRRARATGHKARMLPAVSAEDCLFADLGVDPATTGCQSFEATDFLLRKRKFDTACALVLWQIGVTGELSFVTRRNLRGVRVLVDYLLTYYQPDHMVVIYQAAQLPVCDSIMRHVPLAKVPRTRFTSGATLYIPPQPSPPPDPAMLRRLKIRRTGLRAR